MNYDTKVYIIVGIAVLLFIGLLYLFARPTRGRRSGCSSSYSSDSGLGFFSFGGDGSSGGDCGSSDSGSCGD